MEPNDGARVSVESAARERDLHWRTFDGDSEACAPREPVLVLMPDLEHDGGVTNYYRTLRLDRFDNVDYFFVNKTTTRSRLEKSFHALGIMARFVCRVGRYSLIHVNPSLNPNSFYRDWFFIAVAKLTGRKVLVFYRGWEPGFEARLMASPLLIRLFRWTYGRADRVITLGDVFRRKLLGLGLDRGVPIHIDTTVADSTGLEHIDVGAKIRAGDGVLNCLFMSRVIRRKGVFTAIEAVAQCNEMLGRTSMRLVVAGEGPDLEEARRYAAERERACVEFAGVVRDQTKIELLKRSQVLLFPTTHGEGLPNTVLEAMLAGMVVVTRRAGAIPEVVETGKNGLVTESTDPATFANYLVRLANEPSLVERIASHNRAAAGAFATESVRRRLLNTYRLCLDPTAARQHDARREYSSNTFPPTGGPKEP